MASALQAYRSIAWPATLARIGTQWHAIITICFTYAGMTIRKRQQKGGSRANACQRR